jgi:hypothetical protein
MVLAIFILYILDFLHLTHQTEEDFLSDIWEKKLNTKTNG